MSELLDNKEYKKNRIKEILKKLSHGEDVAELKKEFKDLLNSISPLEIPLIEQELLKEGVSADEMARMCDLHVELFRESVSKKFNVDVPPGHPLHTLYAENDQIIKDAELLGLYAKTIEKSNKDFRSLLNLAKQLPLIGLTHYTREEMLCFPYLERRGITAVPSTLWRKHDEIRAKIKLLIKDLDNKQKNQNISMGKIIERINDLSRAIADMAFRENNILYPTLKTLLSEGEWVAINEEEKIFGYYKIHPSKKWKSTEKPVYPYQINREITKEEASELPDEIKSLIVKKENELDKQRVIRKGDIRLDKGYLLPEEINSIFKTLPFGISFIDEDDRVRFFSGGKRTFSRTESIIGRSVQFCHPPKSVGVVNKILKAFKEGRREQADFWINIGDSLIYIQYIPVRNENGEYLETLEVEQNVTEIRKLKGEKRILDWRDKN